MTATAFIGLLPAGVASAAYPFCDGGTGPGAAYGFCFVDSQGAAAQLAWSNEELWNYYCHQPYGYDMGPYPGAILDEDPGSNTLGELVSPVRWLSHAALKPGELEYYHLNPTGTYRYYDVMCYDYQPTTLDEPGWWRVRRHTYERWIFEETEPIDPEEWRDDVAAGIDIPTPEVNLAPDVDNVVVNVDTWVWLDPSYWETETRADERGIATIEVRASPVRITIDPGDGTASFTCDGPAASWDAGADPAGACTHVYEIPSQGTFSGSVTVLWEYTWTFMGVGIPIPFFTADATTLIFPQVGELPMLEVG